MKLLAILVSRAWWQRQQIVVLS